MLYGTFQWAMMNIWDIGRASNSWKRLKTRECLQKISIWVAQKQFQEGEWEKKIEETYPKWPSEPSYCGLEWGKKKIQKDIECHVNKRKLNTS